jgi:hypothetical protein
VRAGAERVLLLAAELLLLRIDRLGEAAHGLIGDGVPQAVGLHVVDERGVAVLGALTRTEQHVRGLRHRLLAAGDDDLVLAGADELVGERNGVQAGEAHLVDGERRNVQRDAALVRGLTRGDLAGAGLEHLAHDHVVDLVAAHPGLLEGALDGVATQVGSGLRLQTAEQAADGGARTGDDDGLGHEGAPLTTWGSSYSADR